MGSRRIKKRFGISVVVAGLSFCLWAGCLNRVWDATTFRIKEGMTKDEVRALAGSPNHTENGGTLWAYWTVEDGPTAPLNPVCVKFDADGRVTAVWK